MCIFLIFGFWKFQLPYSNVKPKTLLKTDSVANFKKWFQVNFKVTRITLTETILLPYCHRLIEHVFVLNMFQYATTKRNFGKKVAKTSRNFQGNIWSSSFSFLMPKQQPRPHSD